MRNIIIATFCFLSLSIFSQVINYEVTGYKIRMKKNEKWTNWTEFAESNGYIKVNLKDSLISLKCKIKDEYSMAFYSILNHEIEINEEENMDIIDYYSCFIANGEKMNILVSNNNKCVLITEEEFEALYRIEFQ